MVRKSEPPILDFSDKRTWAKVPAAAICDKELRHGPFRTLCVIALHANGDGCCWLKVDTIAKIRGVSGAQIQSDTFVLKERGFLIVTPTMRRRGGNGANEYQLIYPRLPIPTIELELWDQ